MEAGSAVGWRGGEEEENMELKSVEKPERMVDFWDASAFGKDIMKRDFSDFQNVVGRLMGDVDI